MKIITEQKLKQRISEHFENDHIIDLLVKGQETNYYSPVTIKKLLYMILECLEIEYKPTSETPAKLIKKTK